MSNSFLCQRYGQLSFLQTKGDLTQPIPSVLFLKGHILAWGSLLIGEDKQSKNQIFTFKSVCICLCECVHTRNV